MVRQPRWSEPTEYELLPEIMDRFVCKPATSVLLMSSMPTDVATWPAPSALNVAPMPTGPLESKPRSAMAYCPFNSDSLPEPQAALTALIVSEKVICLVIGTVSESLTSTTMLFVVLGAVGVPVIVADGLPGLNTKGVGSPLE